MKKCILLFCVLFSSILSFAQDSSGYQYYSQRGEKGVLRFVITPQKFITYDDCDDLSFTSFSMGISCISAKMDDNSLKEKYTLDFMLPCYSNKYIDKGGRLLLKYENGDTLTIETDNDIKSDYSNGQYFFCPKYVVTKDDLKQIIQKKVVKMRFEAFSSNIDLKPNKESFVSIIKDFVDGIETRLNNNVDSFNSDF